MKNIIFDLDGTLWDSTETIVKAWNDVLAESQWKHSKLDKKAFQQIMGLPFHEIGEHLLPELSEEQRNNILVQCNQRENDYLKKHGGQLYEGVQETLNTLKKNQRLFIVSNCQDGYIEAFYHYHKLEQYFDDYENPGRTGLSKAENIQLIMKRNQLENSIYVGDTDGDFQAAQIAGIPFIYAKYGFGKVENSHNSIERFRDLLTIDF
ncbi:putative phosphatase [Bacillus sp. TS-2]|nr:putative phosphatase [Bacillus sp. TS-2]